jgi:AcrR family transcriptional regulator
MPRAKKISDDEVLEAVARVMFAHAPADFTLAAAAKETGLSPSTLLQRFGDKQRLIVRALSRDTGEFERLLAEAPPGRSREAVMDLFWLMTPDIADPTLFADQLLWLREDFRDPEINAISRARFGRMRAAIAERLPPLAVAPEIAVRLLEAQWHGAMIQWGFFQEGRLAEYVAQRLGEWFDLAEGAAPQ